MDSINDRIREIRKRFCNDSNTDFANKMEKQPNNVNNWVRDGYSVGRGVIADILTKFPEVSDPWLRKGDGEMLKGQQINNSGTINAQNGVVGQVHGDFHSNGGKDQMIDEQKKEVDKMFEAIIVAVNGFQKASERHDDYVVRQDDYIKRQDEYIANIIHNSYMRNERNMERIDKVLDQQNELIRMVVDQNQRTQDRADKLLDMLGKKI